MKLLLRCALRLFVAYMRELLFSVSFLFLAILLFFDLYTYAILVALFIVLAFFVDVHLGKKLEKKFNDKSDVTEHNKQGPGNPRL